MKCFGSASKAYRCKIVLLDDTELIQEIKNGYKGQDLLDIVFKHLGLLETAYFGLRFVNSKGYSCWLKSTKNVIKQIKGVEPITFYFGVKFYASDPCKLLEECTRYQFFLQIKQDIQQSRLSITAELAAQLLAYIIQSELGDYDPKTHQFGYVSEFKLIVNQSIDFENKVCDLHKKLIGQIPAAVEMQFLERIKWLDLYGCELHSVIADDTNEYFLAISPHGIIVLKNKFKVGNYFWPRIVKVFRKGRFFMIRVVDKNNEENTYGFEMSNKHASKHICRSCKEHQEFFKLTQSNDKPKNGQSTLTRQTVERIDRPAPSLVRVPSRRYQRLGRPDGSEGGNVDLTRDNSYLENKSSILLNGLSRYNSTPALQKSGSLINPKSTSPYSPYYSKERGLFSKSASASPLSVRSAFVSRYDYGRQNYVSHMKRNSSTSSLQRAKLYRSSDNESEVSRYSKSSKQSSRKGRHNRQSEDSGTESDSSKKRKSKRKHYMNREPPKLIDWNEILEKRRDEVCIANLKQSSAIVRNVTRYRRSSVDSDSESIPEYHKYDNNHLVKSLDRKKYFQPEVKKYIQHQLVDISHLNENERKDIRFTKIGSDAKLYKMFNGPSEQLKSRKVDGSRYFHANQNDGEIVDRHDMLDFPSYNIRNKLKGPTSAVHGQTKYYYTNYPNYDPYLEFNTSSAGDNSYNSGQMSASQSAPRVTFQSTHSTAYYSTSDVRKGSVIPKENGRNENAQKNQEISTEL